MSKLGAAQRFEDPRGKLTVLPLDEAPFEITRAYVISDVPLNARRGGHAYRTQHRLLIAISGTVLLTLDDGRRSRALELNGGDVIHIEPGVWHELEAIAEPVAIAVLADGVHDPSDKVADRSELPL
jgi:mannose-6-phosphate isomerase-like protein (cupin superfamily)